MITVVVDPRDPELEPLGVAVDGSSVRPYTASIRPSRTVRLAGGGFLSAVMPKPRSASSDVPVSFTVPATDGAEILAADRSTFTYIVDVDVAGSNGRGRGGSSRVTFTGLLPSSLGASVSVTALSAAEPVPAPYVSAADLIAQANSAQSSASTSASAASASATSAANAAALVGAPADSAIAAAVGGPSATRTALDGRYSRASDRPINVAQQFGRNDAAVRAAFAEAASSGRALHFTNGDFTVTGNITVTTRIELLGDGYTSRLLFTDGGLILDATTAYILHPKIRDLRIRRIGTVAGPALHLKGAGVYGVARITAYNVHLSSPAGNTSQMSNAGDALLIEGSYLGYFHGCYFEEAQYGIRGIVSVGDATGVNSICFYGGEANGNRYGWQIDRPAGVSFYGFATEGNYAGGGRVTGVARGFTYHGGYFELNQGPDIEVDCNAGGGGITIEGNVFFTNGGVKTESILLKRGRVAVNHNHFNSLSSAVAIRVNEGSSPVSGEARNNMRDDDGTVIAYTAGGASFNITPLGKLTKATSTISSGTPTAEAGIEFVRKVSAPLDFPSIPANSEASLTVSVPGAVTTDDCSVSSSILEDGLVLKSWGVTAADTVTIRLRNVTAAAIDPSARTYRVRVWR